MRLKNRKKSAAAIKSMKVGTDELKDLIKGAVKEAMGEEDDTGDDGGDAAAALDGITAEDMWPGIFCRKMPPKTIRPRSRQIWKPLFGT